MLNNGTHTQSPVCLSSSIVPHKPTQSPTFSANHHQPLSGRLDAHLWKFVFCVPLINPHSCTPSARRNLVVGAAILTVRFAMGSLLYAVSTKVG
ncbi:hypothetical protein CDAR_367561 [Caerostris darwini]|uniref:Uncharacterized protein n=1 Tax=Caerostris darwini TaxID=1538125 RepID=A0AAV4WW54_9ARAC|nr:hypothetical protein CDAR_367561 [Caerostris darwini]